VWLAALLLIGVSVGGYFYHRWQLGAIASEHLRVIVTGPATFQAGTAAKYTISTTGINGRAVSALVEATLLASDGARLATHRETTDEHGQLQLKIPVDVAIPSQAALKVVATHNESREEIELPVAVAPVRFAASLAASKPLYRPGETLFFRLAVVPRAGESAGQKLPVQFELVDSNGAETPDARQEAVVEHGVAAGAFAIPKTLAAGQYTLVASSPNRAFREQRRPIGVREYRLPRWEKALVLDRDSYGPGERVAAVFHARRFDGLPPDDPKLHVVATVDGQTVFEKDMVLEKAKTEGAVDAEFEFELPQKIDRGEPQLIATLADGAVMETQTAAISILRGDVNVEFLPESGALVAGVETRVYFVARDSRGRPASLSGTIVAQREEKDRGEKDSEAKNDREEEVAAIETSRNGVGVFSFVPALGETYRLKISRPAGVLCQSKMPEAAADSRVVLSTGAGVFAAGSPLEFNLRSSQAGLPLIVAAYSRGLQVGEQPLVTKAGPTGANPITIPLDDSVAGIVRLAVYDYSVSPPRAVAERLVYRRPARKLNVRIRPVNACCSPGKPVELSFSVANEKGEPTSAVLGVAVVDEAIWGVAGSRVPSMSSRCLLTDELRDPIQRQPEEPGFREKYVATAEKDGEIDAAAIDLLLGTCGKRLTMKATTAGTAEVAKSDATQDSSSTCDEAISPPAMVDNIGRIRDNYDLSLAEFLLERTRVINTLVTVALLCGLGLIVWLTMLGMMRIAWGMHLWMPAIAATLCCLVISVILLNASRQSTGPETTVAFHSYPTAPLPEPRRVEEEMPADRPTAKPSDDIDPTYVHRHASTSSEPGKDLAETLLWNPVLITGADGKATVSLDLSDATSAFRVSVDALGEGRVGSGETLLLSQEPANTHPNAGDASGTAGAGATPSAAPQPSNPAP
jgi:hypothetical protein